METPTMSFTQSDWEHYALCYDRLNELTPYTDMLLDVARALHFSSGMHLLDAACGTGNLLHYVSAPHDNTSTIVACDSAAVMLGRATHKHSDTARFVRTDLNQTLPFPSESFDRVACINTLYAITTPVHLVKEFFRVLKPRGRCVVVSPKSNYQHGLILKAHAQSTTPDAHWEHTYLDPEREADLIREACGDTDLARDLIQISAWNRIIAKSAHFHFFTPEELREMLTAVGFSVIEQRLTYAHQCHLVTIEKP